MSRRPRPARLLAAGMAAIVVIVGCGGPTPSTDPAATRLPGPTGATGFPTAPPSTGAFQRMAYPVAGPAPCEEPASADPAYGPYEGSLRRIFARDPATVVFELCDADPAFLAKIASPALAIDDTAWLQSRLDPVLDRPALTLHRAPALPAEVQPYVDIAVPAVPAEVHQYIDVARGVAVELGYGEQFEQVLDALPAV